MKKKILSLFLVGVLSVVSLGCSSKVDETSKNNTESKPVEIYLTRHGKTMLNTTERMQGWSDAPLTEPGVEVAEYLGKGFKEDGVKFDYVYSSDSGRAIETANIVLDKSAQTDLKLNQDKGLREVCFGIYEGEKTMEAWADVAKANDMTIDEMMKDFNMSKNLDLMDKVPGNEIAENSNELAERVKSTIDKIVKDTEVNGGGNILIVSHGITIISFLENVSPGCTADLKSGLENASVCKVKYENGTYTVESVNDMSYVEKGKNTN
ncbi:MAG: histidine phosphatase family protein [Clostridium sp.]|uniref:histidine phosphatase family protein n=1 Tax=Clostridium sp. TaxID=1506 RepID=UPI00290CDE61|nr:histidine phosphatase family protein [Clostridium sp.]MDU5111708.1 histidine phosphatase family protein [Clostridium sp.]